MTKQAVNLKAEDFFRYPDQILSLYILGFAGYPYFEAFSYKELLGMANELWFSDKNGLLLTCHETTTGRLQGFFIGYDLTLEPKICEVLKGDFKDIFPGKYYYMAEVVTHPEFRSQGIATFLVEKAVQEKKDSYKNFIVRTSVTNAPAIYLYKKCGFNKLETAVERVSHVRTNGQTGEDERLFLTLNV